MVDLAPNLDTVVRELHEIFTEQAVEKDLSTIKRIKKIVSDSNQIVLNRENEIKDVVKALQAKVEGLEQAVEANDSVNGCEKKIRELETQKRQLLRQIENLKSEKEISQSEIEKVRENIKILEEKKQEIEQELHQEVPREKGILALYLNITNIRWDHEATGVRGVIIPPETDPNPEPRSFELDPADGAFENCNRLWDLLD